MKKLYSYFLLLLLALVPQAAMAEYYGLKVAGVKVTSDNCSDITGSRIFTHYHYLSNDKYNTFDSYYSKVSYDPRTKTLTLKDIRIDCKNNEYAIYNESCDDLTIVFEGYNEIRSDYASSLQLNANTTIKAAYGMIGGSKLYTEIKGDEKDAITISNGARLVIADIQMKISAFITSADASTAIVGKTGKEEVVITDAYVSVVGKKALSDLGLFVVQNSGVNLTTRTIAEPVATGLKDVRIFGTEKMKDANEKEVYFSQSDGTFLLKADNSEVTDMSILTYMPIDEETFPDEAFRSLIASKFDANSDGQLDFVEVMEAEFLSAFRLGISSLQGIDRLTYLRRLDCGMNNLTYLDVSGLKHMTQLDCGFNQIAQVKLTNCRSLFAFKCRNNRIPYIDFSTCTGLASIDISGNVINEWMTETLESLPQAKTQNSHITIMGQDLATDNVCTIAQAQIAKDKGWNVVLGNIDDEGNVVYNIQIAGTHITSANAGDLTVIPGVTKNTEWGYARYDISKQTLYLSGVDIVSETGNGIDFNITNASPTIELSDAPVNIIAAENGIAADINTISSLTITTTEADWYSQNLNISAGRCPIALLSGDLVLKGAPRLEAKSTGQTIEYCAYVYGKLYVKDNAELRLKRHIDKPLFAEALILENDNIVVTPEGASLKQNQLKSADGTAITGAEVVIGKLRNYNYYVAGTRISNANQHAVLGDTTVVFQPSWYSNGIGTLILSGANITADSAVGIEGSKSLYIQLVGDNMINSAKSGIQLSTHYLYIDGPGSLYVKGKGQYGIHCGKLNITDAKITAQGTTRYAVDANETTISGRESVLEMKSGPDAYGTFRASTSLTLNDGLKIDIPEGAQYVDGVIKDASGNVITNEWVIIQYTEDYGISVAGIKVNNHNMEDVLGDGSVSYDPATKTLTLDGADIESETAVGIYTKTDNLKVNLIGENSITVGENVGMRILRATDDSPVTFMGGGSLQIKANGIGLQLYVDAVLTDGVNVTAESLSDTYAGIQGRKAAEGPLPSITMTGEGTTLKARGGSLGSMIYIHALNLDEGFQIVEPAGASFVEDIGILDSNNALAANQWVVIANQDYIDGIESLTPDPSPRGGENSFKHGSTTVNLAGQKVGTDYKGIIVTAGKKYLRK